MNKFHFVYALLPVIGLAFGGCTTQDRSLSCESGDDCAESEICYRGVCVPVDCQTDADCPSGQLCVDNECETPEACTGDDDCESHEACIEEICTRVECKTDTDCPAEATCQEYHCVEGPECGSDGDCDIGTICEREHCVTGCRTNRDCPSDLICLPEVGDYGLCAECELDSDCDQGFKCISYVCALFCESDADCPEGYCDTETNACVECTFDNHCVQGFICMNLTCQAGCRADSDCLAYEICENLACRTGCRNDADCSGGVCDLSTLLCVECEAADDCAIGHLCIEGQCVEGCERDRDCPPETVCAADLGDHGLCVQCLQDEDCPGGACDPATHTCYGVCTSNDDCAPGEICHQGTCVAGCLDDLDCPQDTHCEAELGPHGTCVQCLVDSDCPNPDLPRCENYMCAPECTSDEHCPAADEVCIDNQCQQVNMECDLRIQPDPPIQFGSVGVGASAVIPVTLANEGGVECNITEIGLHPSILLAGDFEWEQPPTLPITLPPRDQAGSRVELPLVFAPQGPEFNNARLWITSDDPDLLIGLEDITCMFIGTLVEGQACISITGNGVAIGIEAVPNHLDFGPVNLGCRSGTETVRFHNQGGQVEIASIQLNGSSGAVFVIESAPATPFTLPAGDFFDVELTFTPQAATTYTAELLVSLEGLPDSGGLAYLAGTGTNQSNTTDTFQLPEEMQVDVLWVIDNSGSMIEEQQALSSNFESFIAWATQLGVDYHVGVIATEVNSAEQDVGNPPRDIEPGVLVHAPGRPRYITPDTQYPVTAFQENASLGTCCSDEQEAGLQAAMMALTPPLIDDPAQNGGFLRDMAKLYIIALSDEQDQSAGTIMFYVEFLNALKGTSDRVKFSAIVGDCPNGCGPSDQAACGSRYIAAAEETEGLFRSICASDWSQMMDDLGEDAFEPIRSLVLSRTVSLGTLQVQVNGQTVPEAPVPFGANGWTHITEDNAIWFGDNVVPANGSTVQASYTAACL